MSNFNFSKVRSAESITIVAENTSMSKGSETMCAERPTIFTDNATM